MADESIVISVKDEVASTPADKFREMAEQSIKAAAGIEQLKKSIGSIPTSTLSKLSTALDSISKSTTRVVTAQTKANDAADKAAVMQQRLATETAKTAAAEASAEAAKVRLAAATEKATSAATKQASATATASERMLALAKAGVAAAQVQRDQTNAYFETEKSLKTYNAATQENVQFTQAQILSAQNATKAARDKIKADRDGASAEQKLTATVDQMSAALDRQAKSAKLSRNQILTLQYTASDVVASLGSGISPLTIALQQGPQVAQSFTKELAAMFVRFGPLIGAASALAVAIGTLGTAYLNAVNNSNRFNNAIKLTGNFAGITEGSFNELNQRIAETNRISVAAAAEITQGLTESGRFQRQELEQNAQSIVLLAKYTDQSASDILKSFDQMAEGPTAFAEAQNKSIHFMSAAQLELVRNLEETGQKSAATAIVSKQLADYLGGLGARNVNVFSQAWSGLSNSISDAFTDLGIFLNRSSSVGSQLADVNRQIAATMASDSQSAGAKALLATLQAQRAELEKQNKVEQEAADKKSADLKNQQELYETGKRISGTWLSYANNVETAKDKIDELRRDIDKGLTADKSSDTYKNAVTLQQQQAAIERSITEQYTKSGTSRAAALAKINGELDKQVNGLNVLKPAREIQQQMDQYDIELAGQKITLNDSERASIEAKLKSIQDSKAAQEEYDRIYTEVQAPLKNYTASLSAAKTLLDQSAISQAQYEAQVNKATETYNRASDPMFELNKAIQDQIDLLSLQQPQREVAQQMQQAQNQLLGTTAELYDRETGALTANGSQYQERLQYLQKATQLQQAYDAVIATSTGAATSLNYQIKATNQAYQDGSFSLEAYSAKMIQLQAQSAQLRLDLGKAVDGDALTASLGRLTEGYTTAISGISKGFGDMFVSLEDGFANAIGGAIAGTESLGDALANVAQTALAQLISSLIKVGIQYALNAALGTTAASAATAANIALGAATAAAWAPAAAAVSLASFGSNAIPAATAMTSTYGLATTLSAVGAAGFKTGGYTGDQATTAVAGVVHGQEFVFDAQATKRIGVDQLESLRSGRTTEVSSGTVSKAASVGSANAGSSVNLNVINNADNSKVTTSQQTDSNGNMDYTVTIDNIEKALASKMASGRGPLNNATKNAFGLKASPNGG